MQESSKLAEAAPSVGDLVSVFILCVRVHVYSFYTFSFRHYIIISLRIEKVFIHAFLLELCLALRRQPINI